MAAGNTYIEHEGVTYIAWPDQGCFVEQGSSPEMVGALWMPMNADGSAAVEDLSEIMVPYSEA